MHLPRYQYPLAHPIRLNAKDETGQPGASRTTSKGYALLTMSKRL